MNPELDTPRATGSDFTHLEVHSHFTLLGGTASIPDLVGRALADGMTHLALTDTNALYGAVAFDRLCRESGIRPILGMTVIKDLVVDMKPFFEHYRSVMPYFVNDDDPPERERLQDPVDREIFDEGTKCILCAACTSSCPSFWANETYVGPAAIVQAHRFIFDNRDQAAKERLAVLSEENGVWRCRTIFNCTSACPREIPVTQLIAEVKGEIGKR